MYPWWKLFEYSSGISKGSWIVLMAVIQSLREANDGAVVLADHQTELEQSQQELATLTKQLELVSESKKLQQCLLKRILHTQCWKARLSTCRLSWTGEDMIRFDDDAGKIVCRMWENAGLESAHKASEKKTESLSVELRDMHRERQREKVRCKMLHAVGAKREKREAWEKKTYQEARQPRKGVDLLRGVSFGDKAALYVNIWMSVRGN